MKFKETFCHHFITFSKMTLGGRTSYLAIDDQRYASGWQGDRRSSARADGFSGVKALAQNVQD